MSNHNKFYSVYSTGSGYKYEVTESFDDGDFVSISNELNENGLKGKCYPILAGIYDNLGLHYSRFKELGKNVSDFVLQLSGSGITYDYATWASSSFVDHYSGSYSVDDSITTRTYDVAADSSVYETGSLVGTVTFMSSRIFTFNELSSGAKETYYSDDGVHYIDSINTIVWIKQ